MEYSPKFKLKVYFIKSGSMLKGEKTKLSTMNEEIVNIAQS